MFNVGDKVRVKTEGVSEFFPYRGKEGIVKNYEHNKGLSPLDIHYVDFGEKITKTNMKFAVDGSILHGIPAKDLEKI